VLEPSKIYLAKALTGDSSDNIKGVPRIPKKQLEPILNDPKCVDIDSFYAIIANKPISISDTMWKRTLESESQIRANYKVILPNLEGFTKSSVKRIFKNQQNYNKLVETLKRYECYSVLSKIGAIYE
jgi:5'-3' exonuclease